MIIAAAGTSRFASALAQAGVDRIVAYHSSAYRTRGLPSVAGLLPWASANEQTLDMLPQVLAGADGQVPVIATVCANDGLRPPEQMVTHVQKIGASGVLNAPTVGFYEGTLRSVLEAEGLGRDSEIELMSHARAAGMEAWAYVFDPEWTRLAIQAGATGVIIHLGITGYPSPTDGSACVSAARAAGCHQILLHGGDLRSPTALTTERASYGAENSYAVNGFMGASVFEKSDDTAAEVRDWRAVLTNN